MSLVERSEVVRRISKGTPQATARKKQSNIRKEEMVAVVPLEAVVTVMAAVTVVVVELFKSFSSA